MTIPACEPVRLIARWPRSLIAIAHSAQDDRSPVESSMSISRGSGFGEISLASAISRSVSLPRALSTATTRVPCSRLATIRCAARLRRSASATDVPPNFMTTVSGIGTVQDRCRARARSPRAASRPSSTRAAASATSHTLPSGSDQYEDRPPQKASSGSLRIVAPAARMSSIAASTSSRSSTLIAIDMATPWFGGAAVVCPSCASDCAREQGEHGAAGAERAEVVAASTASSQPSAA